MSSSDGSSLSKAGKFWVYTGLVFGAVVSVCANIAYTFIPPRSAPVWWPAARPWDPSAYRPPLGDVAFAVFCPIAIFITTEVVTRPRWKKGVLPAFIRGASTVMVGLPVAVASYLHLCSLLSYYSLIPVIAYTLPLTVDGLMLACTAALQLTGDDAEDLDARDPESERRSRRVPPSGPAVPHDPGADGGRAAEWTERPPAGDASGTGGQPSVPVMGPEPPEGAPVDAGAGASSTSSPPVGWAGLSVGSGQPPVGDGQLPVVLFRAPAVVATTGFGAEAGIGGPMVAESDPRGRPAPSGRLGAANLDDEKIAELAIADRPGKQITATALRKDFGVGTGRAIRIRELIKRKQAAEQADPAAAESGNESPEALDTAGAVT